MTDGTDREFLFLVKPLHDPVIYVLFRPRIGLNAPGVAAIPSFEKPMTWACNCVLVQETVRSSCKSHAMDQRGAKRGLIPHINLKKLLTEN
ncbi:hypothetical protein QQP08_001996 [Theobroma cacao]|nr:hypothetical protein QQP08_001996 [Theobroma cacao]